MIRKSSLWAAGVLAAVTLLLSTACLVALNTGGEARVGGLALMHISAGYDRAADAIVTANASSRPELERARRLSENALRQYPYDQGAWLRLAYIDAQENGRLTGAGQADLRRSYDLVAIDPVLGPLRVRLALENCSDLSRDLLNSVHAEVDALWSNGRARSDFAEMRSALRSPAGRLALTLWIDGLERAPRR